MHVTIHLRSVSPSMPKALHDQSLCNPLHQTPMPKEVSSERGLQARNLSSRRNGLSSGSSASLEAAGSGRYCSLDLDTRPSKKKSPPHRRGTRRRERDGREGDWNTYVRPYRSRAPVVESQMREEREGGKRKKKGKERKRKRKGIQYLNKNVRKQSRLKL